MSQKITPAIVTSAPISGLLGVAFVVLKLCGVIAWSWVWVLSPFWIPFAVGVLIALAWVVFAVLAAFLTYAWLKSIK